MFPKTEMHFVLRLISNGSMSSNQFVCMTSKQKFSYEDMNTVNLSLSFSLRGMFNEAHTPCTLKRKTSNGKIFDWTKLIVFIRRQPVDFPYLMQKYSMKINESISSLGEI